FRSSRLAVGTHAANSPRGTFGTVPVAALNNKHTSESPTPSRDALPHARNVPCPQPARDSTRSQRSPAGHIRVCVAIGIPEREVRRVSKFHQVLGHDNLAGKVLFHLCHPRSVAICSRNRV